MIDRSVMVKLLEILDQLDGVSIEENTLFNEISLKAARPVSTRESGRRLVTHLEVHGRQHRIG